MPVCHYLSRLWLACSLSFYLFVPYLSRYLDAKNRFSFHWIRADLFSLVFCIIVVGFFFFLSYAVFYGAGNAVTRKICEIIFIMLVGIALKANASHLMITFTKHSPVYFNTLGILAWIFMFGCIVWLLMRQISRVKSVCILLCFLPSLIFPIFTINALRYPSYTSDIGAMPAAPDVNAYRDDSKSNVYLFIFDEWSYQRTFQDRYLIQLFPNLQQFADQAIVFHSAQAPSSNTDSAMPSILCQTRLRFTVRGTELGFQGREFHPLDQAENIFHHAQEQGFFTAMVGSAIPYGEILGNSVDFCRSIAGYKRFGNSFFGVAKYHLLTAALLLPAPFFQNARGVIAHYFSNKFQTFCISTTHELFIKVIKSQQPCTVALFHYMLPHFPYVFTPEGGYKEFFTIYSNNDPSHYYDSLAYLDKMIGEVIATLREANKFEESLVIFTTDHGWRYDPGYDVKEWRLWSEKMRHVPLFIKLPYQKHPVEIDTKFETFHLGNFINRYLDTHFDLQEAERLFREENSFKPRPLEEEITEEPEK